MTSFLKNALDHKGFSVVEILSQCPTHFGRYALGTGSPKALVDWIKERSVPAAAADKMPPEEVAGKYLLGEFVNIEKPVFRGSTVYPAAGGEEGR
jgi:2-oxoglutarate ferredoxin oxidoreductase subunit beta